MSKAKSRLRSIRGKEAKGDPRSQMQIKQVLPLWVCKGSYLNVRGEGLSGEQ